MQGISYKKQSKDDTKFLDAWRALETACKDEGPLMVADLERNLESQSRPDDASMLRMCRMLRNFMVHDGCGFAEPTKAMTDFLVALESEVCRAKGTVSDHKMTPARYGYLVPDDPISAAGKQILSKKRTDALVLDASKKPVGIFGARAMAASLDAFHGLKSVRDAIDQCLLDPVPTVFASEPSKSAPDHKCAVIDAKGVCTGIWNADRGWS